MSFGVELTMEWSSDLDAIYIEAEIQLADVPASVDEGVCVVLQQQILQGAHLAHEAEEIVVTAEEYVKTHLNVVVILIDERSHFAPHKWSLLVDIHLITLV